MILESWDGQESVIFTGYTINLYELRKQRERVHEAKERGSKREARRSRNSCRILIACDYKYNHNTIMRECKCGYKWQPKVVEPKACPRCKQYKTHKEIA